MFGSVSLTSATPSIASRLQGGAFMVLAAALILASQSTASANTFNTFVTNGDIAAAEGGQTNVISFAYAGNKFVGSLYFGANNLQLYSTNLNGTGVAQFGSPLPAGGGEVVLGVSIGSGGFNSGDIFAGSQGTANIYRYSNAGGAPSFFGTLPTGIARQITFDTGGLFGGNMIVTTSAGDIYKFNPAGVPTLIASVGEDTEGVDIVTSKWGIYAGWLAVASEGSGALRLISPTGAIVDTGVRLGALETVNFVPLNLGASGNPVEGLYVANFGVDIQKADASAFAGLQGDAIVSQEFGSNAPFSVVGYDPMTNTFSVNSFANIPNQSEDAIFVTAQKIESLVPEIDAGYLVSAITVLTGGIMLLRGRRAGRRLPS